MSSTQEILEQLGEPTAAYYPKAHGFFGTLFDWLERPSRMISEAYGAARHDEDISDAALQALTGKYKYPTLGYQLVPEAKEPGFQAEDIPAFAIDVLADPLNIALPFVGKAVGKAVSKGVLTGTEKLVPKFFGALPEMQKGLTPKQSLKALIKEAKDLGLGPEGLVKRFEQHWPDPESEILGGMWQAMRTGKRGTKPVATWSGIKEYLKDDVFTIDSLRAELRAMDINYRPAARTGLQSLAQEVAMRFWPMGVTLKRFGGPAGEKVFRGYKDALNVTRLESIPLIDKLQKIFKGVPERIRIQSAIVRERPSFASLVDPRAVEIAEEWGKVLNTVGDDVRRFRDPLGNPMQIWNDSARKWEPFADHWVENYYPHRYPKEVYTVKGRKTLVEKLVAEGVDRRQANAIVDRASKRPRRVGSIEMMRHGDDLGYEKDPLKVLPKYIHDVVFRKNLANQFGVNSEILDVALDDMFKTGLSRHWVNKVGDLINGTNIHDRVWEKVGSWLAGTQAVTKLGFATTVANGLQAPINQFIMVGPKATLKGALGVAQKRHRILGLAAFSRSLKDDVVAMTTGKGSFFNRYMQAIGFNLTEQKGRHMGAIAGLLDVDKLSREYGAAFAKNPKVAKRKAWQLMHRYGIDVRDEDLYEALRQGVVPARARELAALEAADKTMHAFNIMELPPAWRDPMWRTFLQFKSFVYKQMDFMTNQVAVPAMRYFASDGKIGDVGPLLRSVAGLPFGAELVMHLRDVAKSIPAQAYGFVKEGELNNWDYKKPFWEDPDPGMRLFHDLTYIGTLGIVGDALEAAEAGRLWKYAAGPTFSDLIEAAEAPFRGTTTQWLSRRLTGPLGLPYSTDIFEKLPKEWREWTR